MGACPLCDSLKPPEPSYLPVILRQLLAGGTPVPPHQNHLTLSPLVLSGPQPTLLANHDCRLSDSHVPFI